MSRKPPRWTVAFLRALERTGEVEAAARDAGIDKSTAYARRRAHADFAEAWDNALRLRSGRTETEVQERVGFWEKVKGKGKVSPKLLGSGTAGRSAGEEKQSLDRLGTNGGRGFGSNGGRKPETNGGRTLGTNGGRKEELLATTALGGKIVRAGPGRWIQEREKIFFDELAATANVSRAAEAAGVSKNAVYARRMKRPDFKGKWDAVLETGRAAIEMHLVETAKKSFDPDELDVEGVEPKVSVAEAIRIVQLHGSKAQRETQEQMLAEQAESMSADEVAQIRERLVVKLSKLRQREMPRMIEQGWSYDEGFDHMVPPGWVKAEDSAESGGAEQ